MSTKKQILRSEWQDRLQSFTSGNRNRPGSIEVQGKVIVENKLLISVDYDPVGKGDDMSITLEDFGHTINSPTEMYMTKDAKGVVKSLEIIDSKGGITILRL